MKRIRFPSTLRWKRVGALLELEFRELANRHSLNSFLLLFLFGMTALRMALEARVAGSIPPSPGLSESIARRTYLEILVWSLMVTGSTIMDTLYEKRADRGLEPLLATSLTDLEIVVGKISLPALSGFLAGILSWGTVMVFRYGIYHLPLPGEFFSTFWLLIFLPPVAILSAALATTGGLLFRSTAPMTFLILLPGGLLLMGVASWLTSSYRFSLVFRWGVWFLFVLITAGSLLVAKGFLKREKLLLRA